MVLLHCACPIVTGEVDGGTKEGTILAVLLVGRVPLEPQGTPRQLGRVFCSQLFRAKPQSCCVPDSLSSSLLVAYYYKKKKKNVLDLLMYKAAPWKS